MELDFNNQKGEEAKPQATPPIQPQGQEPTQTIDSVQPQPSQSAQTQPAQIQPAQTVSPAPAPKSQRQTKQTKPSPSGHKSKLMPILVIVLAVIILGGGTYFVLMTDMGKRLVGLSSGKPQELSSLPSMTPNEQNSVTPPRGALPESESTAAAHDKQRKSDLAQVKIALEAYKIDQGSYPISANFSQINSPSSTIYTALVSGGYVTTLPSDPLAPDYWYGYKSVDGENYILTARLEVESDPAGTARGDLVLYQLTN